MKKLLIYYSYSGSTKKSAQSIARQDGADQYEIKDKKRPGTLKAYTSGCLAAMRGKCTAVEPIKVDLAAYDAITVMSPVWASHPAPAVNNVFEMLPSGKSVHVIMVSASGNSGAEAKLKALIESKGSTLESYENRKNK